ncbi:MAG: CDP-alcohol phosphatidyltransferase family protein [Magnetococcales bacterium]|nr:CDP-alcohol phosphatidyltransferase family protein [Magnetococcales bacterium]MBF0419654.1 CDP-alcohol phosphatidyltransferase family protein [Magnetococcales bacterium]
MNIPNFLSFVRIFSVPVFIWMVLNHHHSWALILFITAAFTDALDGFLAKKLNQITEIGKFLDPIADKVLLISSFVTLTINGLIPLWITLIVVTRDMVIIIGAVVFQVLTGTLRIEPLSISKINTLLQILFIIVVLYGDLFVQPSWIFSVILSMVTVTTILSGVSYILIWTRKAVEIELK